MCAKRSEHGFLLIEVLVAIVIIAVTVTALLTGLRQALQMTARSEEFTQAALPMETLLFEIETGARADLLENGGSVENESRKFEVSREIIFPAEPDDSVSGEPNMMMPFFKLEIKSADHSRLQFDTGEIFLGQELFS